MLFSFFDYFFDYFLNYEGKEKLALIRLDQACDKIIQGEIIGVPTESVYGLSVDARNTEAVKKLINLKGRDSQKGFIIITSEIEILESLGWIKKLSPEDKNKLNNIWPGPVTYLLPSGFDNGSDLVSPLAGETGPKMKSRDREGDMMARSILTGQHSTIAVRISGHPVLLALAQQLKCPIVSTSANPQGLLPAKDLESFFNYFGQDFPVLAGKLGGLEKPTAIFDLCSGRQLR